MESMVGRVVRVTGLAKAADLNGLAGEVRRFFADKGRYAVALGGIHGTKLIKAANLEVIDGGSSGHDENGGLKPGDRVTVTGLRSRPELNGKVAVVLAPEVKGERVKVTAFPAPIAVKRSCLSPAPAALDWSFADFLPPGVDPADNSIRGLIRAPGSPLGSIDRCDSLLRAVASLFPEMRAGLPPSRTVDLSTDDVLVRAMLDNTQVHALYYLEFDAMGHHVILETQGGLARTHQSFIRARLETPFGKTITSGYTARDWSLLPSAGQHEQGPAENAAFVRARARWGSARELSRDELKEYMERWAELQRLTDAAVKEMVPQLPPGLVEPGDPAPTVGPDAGTTFAALQGGAARLDRWCAALIDRPETMSIYGDEHYLDTTTLRIIASNEHYTAGPHFTIEVSAPVAQRIAELYSGLTGEIPNAGNYIQAIKWRHWRTVCGMRDGHPSAVGWAFFCGQVPH